MELVLCERCRRDLSQAEASRAVSRGFGGRMLLEREGSCKTPKARMSPRCWRNSRKAHSAGEKWTRGRVNGMGMDWRIFLWEWVTWAHIREGWGVGAGCLFFRAWSGCCADSRVQRSRGWGVAEQREALGHHCPPISKEQSHPAP